MVKKLDQFNMVISGVGGQGLITLLQIVAEASLSEGYDIRTSELHGLSQRGGSVEVHIRFGQEIYSPMVSAGQADLILGLEMQEGLMAVNFAGPKTKLLINKYIIPLPPERQPRGEKKIYLLRTPERQPRGKKKIYLLRTPILNEYFLNLRKNLN